jgi:hypothetical protein
MDDIVIIVEKFVDRMKDEIYESYEKFSLYINDLIISKKVNTMLNINTETEEDIRRTIIAIINATNSALSSIGVSTDNLSSENEIFRENFEENENMYSNYNSFLQLGLKDYVNSHLFVIFIEYLTDIDKAKTENLDLFDLLPRKFLNKLDQFKNEIQISEDVKNRFIVFIIEIWKYFDSSKLTFKLSNLEMKASMDATSEADILKMLQEARMDNINALKQPINQIQLNNGKNQSFLEYFVNFPKLSQSIIEKIGIDTNQLSEIFKASQELLDLENLFYTVSIFKMLGVESPFEANDIIKIVSEFVSGRVFSTGKYHIPNSVSIFYGLSILTELDLLNNSDIIDLLDIEMFLENEIGLNKFMPEKLTLNFFTLLSLRLLENNGGIITDKSYLIKPLANLDLLNLDEFKPSSDIFFYLALLRLLDSRVDFSNLKDFYFDELKQKMLHDGSINGSITESARALLIFRMLNSNNKELNPISNLLNFLNQNLSVFKNSLGNNFFNWKTDKLALKIELRMLFWALIALSQYI